MKLEITTYDKSLIVELGVKDKFIGIRGLGGMLFIRLTEEQIQQLKEFLNK